MIENDSFAREPSRLKKWFSQSKQGLPSPASRTRTPCLCFMGPEEAQTACKSPQIHRQRDGALNCKYLLLARRPRNLETHSYRALKPNVETSRIPPPLQHICGAHNAIEEQYVFLIFNSALALLQQLGGFLSDFQCLTMYSGWLSRLMSAAASRCLSEDSGIDIGLQACIL